MAFFLVDLEFRKRVKNCLRPREVWACVLVGLTCALMAPSGCFLGICRFLLQLATRNSSALALSFDADSFKYLGQPDDYISAEDTMESACNPKFPRLCVNP